MRKNVNKLVALAIGISVINGSIMPAFAADSITNTAAATESTVNTNVQSNVLTLDDAINSAISISDTLALDEKEISYQDRINNLNEDKDYFNNVSDDQEDYDNDSAEIALNKLKQQRDFDKDSLVQKVTDQYNNIVTSQMQIDMATKKLTVDNKKLQEAKLKQNLGMQTSVDTQSSELQIQKEQNSLTTSENQLKDAEYTFKVLTGKDVTQYTLEKDIEFEPLKIDGAVDDYYDKVIDSYLKYSDELVKLNKDYYDKDYEKDNDLSTDDLDKAKKDAEDAEATGKPTKPADADTNFTAYLEYQNKLSSYNNTVNKYTNLLGARLTYLNTKLNNYSTEVNIKNTRKQFKDALRGYYTNLQSYEDSINYYKKEIMLYNEQLKNYKLKSDLGMMTESDYNAQVVSTMQAEIDLRNAIISYNKNKEYIQKPWIASSNAQ